jgi:ribonuclease Z
MQNKNDYITMLGTGNALATRCYNTCFTLHGEKGVLLVDAGGGNGILTQMEVSVLSGRRAVPLGL